MWKEFQDFVKRGNVLDMAVGIVIGAAFGAVIKALVDNVIMPPIGLLLGNVDFANIMTVLKGGDPAGPYASLAQAQEAGAVVIAWGVFINAVISFLIIAFVIFLLVKYYNKLQKEEVEETPAAPSTKECLYCHMEIPIEAVRCPYCTTELT